MQSSFEKKDTEEEKRKAEELRGCVEEEEVFYGLLDDISYKVEEARRIDLESNLEESQTIKDMLLSHSQEGSITSSSSLNKFAYNWKQMIESGDVNVLKTLETYNAIHRIPASLIRRHFTVTVINGREIK
eukprot:scaffold5488_cov160-Ochromonas_danica.AAC.2